MATEAAKLMLQCVCSGSLSLFDMEIERRPYHKNCSCALHKSKGAISTTCLHHKTISFSKKQSGNDLSMSITASNFSSPSSFSHRTLIRSRNEINVPLSSREQNFNQARMEEQVLTAMNADAVTFICQVF